MSEELCTAVFGGRVVEFLKIDKTNTFYLDNGSIITLPEQPLSYPLPWQQSFNSYMVNCPSTFDRLKRNLQK